MEVREVRRKRLEQVIREMFGGSQTAFSEFVGRQQDYVSRILHGHRNLGERLARDFEAKLSKPAGWFDSMGDAAKTVAEPRMLYGYAISEAGAYVGREWDKLHEPMRSSVQTLIEMLVAAQVRVTRAGADKKARAVKGQRGAKGEQSVDDLQ